MIKRLVSTAAIAGLVMMPTATAAQAQVNLDEAVKDSLVLISLEFTGWVHMPPGVADPTEAVWSDETKIYGSCTGFVVDPSGFIATAGHCVEVDADRKQKIREKFVIDAVNSGKLPEDEAEGFLRRANAEAWPVEGKEEGAPIDRIVQVIQPNVPGRVIDNLTTAQVIDLQSFEDGDNALLKVSGMPPLKPLVIAEQAPKIGQEVTAIGFPGSVMENVDPSRLPQPSFKSGTASSQQVKESGASVTEINADVSAGMSGGPTVDSKTAEVLGINSYGISGETEAFNFITDAPTLRSFLQKNGVNLAEPATSKESSFPWIWIVVVVAVLVVAGLVVLLLVMNRKKSAPQPAMAGVGAPGGPTYTPPGAQPYPPPGGQTYTPPGGQSYPPTPPPGGQTYTPPGGQPYSPPAGPSYSPPPGQTYSPSSGQSYPPSGGQAPPPGSQPPPPPGYRPGG